MEMLVQPAMLLFLRLLLPGPTDTHELSLQNSLASANGSKQMASSVARLSLKSLDLDSSSLDDHKVHVTVPPPGLTQGSVTVTDMFVNDDDFDGP